MHEQFLQLAVGLANNSVNTGEGGPYGAVITKDGEIIAACTNKVTRRLDPTAHAEVMAIREACRKLNDFQLQACTLYTSCEPCPMCLGAIYWARLERVYFACSRQDAAAAGFDDSFIYDEIPLAPAERSIPMLRLNLDDACKPFELWHDKADKIPY
ncbi:MAG: tRNA-specific adenosine deaminase [Gammaproteobacteria bacterium HGW-Gammaproteobacteria-10]|nr:MAG: tRNA-specific adenosine deaminase [Gammaproteobacteria bacterium HGW-Gammaproteobacteria-3]PKM35135.1 MAG: tRNA-specific adenosine deaminase [Gammaproteobacteria bacterium HGW-Gammaproteobacteria-10]